MFVLGLASAQDGPLPDFFWPYGRVELDGANIAPEEQPIVAIVRGQACGAATTLVAEPGPGTPAEDAGKTVYVVDVLADGSGAGQRPGCGRDGDSVSFYFPLLRRFATQTAEFHQGEERVNLTLGPALAATRLIVPSVSDDGPLQ